MFLKVLDLAFIGSTQTFTERNLNLVLQGPYKIYIEDINLMKLGKT